MDVLSLPVFQWVSHHMHPNTNDRDIRVAFCDQGSERDIIAMAGQLNVSQLQHLITH